MPRATLPEIRVRIAAAQKIAVVNANYLHPKSGGQYTVLGHAFDTATDGIVVLYSPTGDEADLQFSRPIEQWDETVTLSDKLQPRLQRIE